MRPHPCIVDGKVRHIRLEHKWTPGLYDHKPCEYCSFCGAPKRRT